MVKAKKVRTNVMFPGEVLNQLRELVPARERSEFIAEATAYKLRMLRQERAIKQAIGAWKDEDHPDLMTDEDYQRWRLELWGGWTDRIERFWQESQAESSDVPAG